MVIVDDATYTKMKDTLYWGNAGEASKAKAKIESSYTDEQYNKFVSWLGQVSTQQATPVNNQPTETATPVKEGMVVKQEEMVGNTAPEIKQEWALKPQSQEYYNQTSDNALKIIKDNLNNYKQTNPEYFNNYEDFKKNFSYDVRTQEQKDVLDNFYKWYEQGLQLSSTPVNDLYTQYKDGQISLNDLELLRTNNPTKYTELQNQINKASILAAYDDTTPTDNKSLQDLAYDYASKLFNQFIDGDYTSATSEMFENYKKNMESPEMLELQDKTTELNEEYKNIEDQIASIRKDTEKEYEWTWATKSKINAIVSDRTYELQQQLRTLGNEYTKYATQYNNRANQYQNEFQLQLQEYQLNMQARNQQMSELGFAMDLMNFETNEQKQQREWDFWVKQQEYTNWNINSSDYQTRYKAALKSVENLLSQYQGIPMQRSAEQMAEDILKNMDANWTSLWEELSTINKQIQGKKEYKMLYNQTYKNPDAWFTDSFTVWDTQYVKYNWKRMTADEVNRMYGGSVWWNPKPYDAVSEEMFSLDPTKWGLWAFLMDPKNADKKTWGQCAKFVNDYLEKIWVGRYFGTESAEERASRCNSNTPKVWTIAVFDYNHYTDGKNYGHVAIVTKVNEDWSFVVKESNFPSWEKIGTRTIQPWSTSLKWFIDFSKWASQVSDNTNTTNLTSEEEAIKKTALAELSYWFLTPTKIAEYGEMAAKQWWDEEWRDAMNQNRWVNMTQDQSNKSISLNDKFAGRDSVKDYKDAVVQLEKLITSAEADNWVWDMAAVFTFMKTLDPSSVVREWEFNSAAKTAWVLNPQALWQKVERLADWEILTPSQRKEFIKIAKEYVKSHSKAYELEYKDLENQYKVQWIPKEALPINWVTYVEDMLEGIDTNWWTTSSGKKTTNTVSGLNILKENLTNMSSNNIKTTSNTKEVTQAKYWI